MCIITYIKSRTTIGHYLGDVVILFPKTMKIYKTTFQHTSGELCNTPGVVRHPSSVSHHLVFWHSNALDCREWSKNQQKIGEPTCMYMPIVVYLLSSHTSCERKCGFCLGSRAALWALTGHINGNCGLC